MANLVRGVAPALLSGLLPVVFALSLSRDEYATWSLAVSLSAYAAAFSLSVQSAVTAATAQAAVNLPPGAHAVPLAAAFEFLAPLMALAYVGSSIVAIFASSLFPSIPRQLIGQFRIALLLLTAAAVAGAFSSVVWGFAIAVGRLRNPLLASLTGRLAAFGCAVTVVAARGSIAFAALLFAAPILASLPIQAAAVRLQSDAFSHRFGKLRRRYRRRYARASRTLGVFSLAMLMVSGVDGAIVGRFDFTHTGVYLLAASVVVLLATVSNSWTSSYLARSPGLDDDHDLAQVRQVARLTMVFNISLACVSAIPMRIILAHLFTPADAHLGYTTFVLLMVANALRQWAYPAVLSAIASERYARLGGQALFEGIANVVLSVTLCAWIGAIGVALGTLIAGALTVPLLLGYTFRGPFWASLDAWKFARDVLVRPALTMAALAAVALLAPVWISSPVLGLGAQVIATCLMVIAAWCWAVNPGERAAARRIFAAVRRSASIAG